MSLPKPSWHSLFERMPALASTDARQDLSATIRLVEQERSRVLLTTYGAPRAALVSLPDIALLRVLDQHPGLLKKVQSFIPN